MMADDEQSEALQYLVLSGDSDIKATETKHHQWLRTLSVVDYGSAQKLVRKGRANMEVVKNLPSLINCIVSISPCCMQGVIRWSRR